MYVETGECAPRASRTNASLSPPFAMPENRLQQLHDAGQSIWLDFIDRTILRNGDLARRIRDDALTGMTSNPTIFEKALAEGTRTTTSCAAAPGGAHGAGAVRARRDVATCATRATSSGRSTRRTNGADGYVSIEVSPGAANDAERHRRRGAAALGDGRSPERDDQGARAPRKARSRCARSSARASTSTSRCSSPSKRTARVIEAYLAGLEDRVRGRQADRPHRVGRVVLRQPRGHGDRQAPRRHSPRRRLAASASGSSRSAARRPSPTRSSRTSCSARSFSSRAMGAAPGGGRAAAASALGEHELQESRLSRRHVRRAAHRAGHGEHDAARHDRRVPRSRRGRAHGRRRLRRRRAHASPSSRRSASTSTTSRTSCCATDWRASRRASTRSSPGSTKKAQRSAARWLEPLSRLVARAC